MKNIIHYQSGSKSESHVWTTALVIQQHFWQLAGRMEIQQLVLRWESILSVREY